MDTERSCGPHYRRGTRHDLPPAPVRKRGPDAFDRFRSGIIHTSFRKLDNRAIGRRLPGRTAINDYIAARATSGGVDPQGHSQQPKHYGARPRVQHCRTRASSHGGYPKPVLELIVGRGLWNGTNTTHTTLDTVLIRVPPHNHQLKDLDYF
ncbi:Uncharacterised protein [Streptococcus pneumoniae]|nr:Uncharacterised protein [Streptococcus pneumoniae]